jgi:hypothetical protein
MRVRVVIPLMRVSDKRGNNTAEKLGTDAFDIFGKQGLV